jgi:hypothetical protein
MTDMKHNAKADDNDAAYDALMDDPFGAHFIISTDQAIKSTSTEASHITTNAIPVVDIATYEILLPEYETHQITFGYTALELDIISTAALDQADYSTTDAIISLFGL